MKIKIYFATLLLPIAYVLPTMAMDRPVPKIQQKLSEQEKQARLKNFMAACKTAGIQCNEKEIRNGSLNLYAKLKNIAPALRGDFWPHLSQLTWVTKLNIQGNQLQTFPLEISHLLNLTSLAIGFNQLQALPPEIGNLVNLTELNLKNNQLQTLPSTTGNLVNLTNLNLNSNPLQSLPPEIGNLVNLSSLYLSDNNLQTVPVTIGNLRSIHNIDLTSCPLLLPQGGSPTNWGQQELRARFGGRVSFDNPNATVMPADTTAEQVYAAMGAQPMRINRDWLQNAVLPDIPSSTLTGTQIVTLFNTIMTQLNTTEESKSGYVSYEVLMNDYSNDNQHAGMANNQYLLYAPGAWIH